jgi:hypothetical protein
MHVLDQAKPTGYLTKVPHIRRPKSGEIIKLEEVDKSEIFLTYIRSALVAID